MDSIVNGVTKNQTGLSDFHFHFLSRVTQVLSSLINASTLCFLEEPGGLQSMGSRRLRHY